MNRLLPLLTLIVLAPRGAWALGDSNLQLVSSAATQAVRHAVVDLDLSHDQAAAAAVSIVPAASHGANWLFEQLLVEELLGRGLGVTLDSTAADVGAQLSYRVIEVGVRGQSSLLSSSISRQCRVGLALSLHRGNELLWTGEGRAEVRDRVSERELDALQHSRFAFAKTEVEKRTWGKYVEPVIVSSVLGSLVYLFYSNR